MRGVTDAERDELGIGVGVQKFLSLLPSVTAQREARLSTVS